MTESIKITGLVTAQVWDSEGNLLSQSQHNTVTTQGLGYLADLMSNTPTKTKFDTAHTYIVLGTGYGGVTVPASQTWVRTQTGSPAPMQLGYPMVAGAFPLSTVTYSATFPAGSLNASNINEACLVNSPISGSGISLAYAQINPAVQVTSIDSLTITWQIQFS